MPGAVVIGLFCTYLIPIKKSQQSRGRLKACSARSDLQWSNHHKDSRARQDKDFFQPVYFALGVVTLPREPQPVIPQKACSTGVAGVLAFPSVH
jgi:hypothetical protein